MPKKINVDKEKITNITKELISSKRYEEINCRNIAKIAGIGVGTLYNYFDSKANILANVMIEDWVKCIGKVKKHTTINEGLKSLYNSISEFSAIYFDLWDYQRKTSFEYIDIFSRHSLIINKVNLVIKEILAFNEMEIDMERLCFISENIVRYASQLYDYEKLEEIFIDIIRRKE